MLWFRFVAQPMRRHDSMPALPLVRRLQRGCMDGTNIKVPQHSSNLSLLLAMPTHGTRPVQLVLHAHCILAPVHGHAPARRNKISSRRGLILLRANMPLKFQQLVAVLGCAASDAT